jgi:hypothetical protein
LVVSGLEVYFRGATVGLRLEGAEETAVVQHIHGSIVQEANFYGVAAIVVYHPSRAVLHARSALGESNRNGDLTAGAGMHKG